MSDGAGKRGLPAPQQHLSDSEGALPGCLAGKQRKRILAWGIPRTKETGGL